MKRLNGNADAVQIRSEPACLRRAVSGGIALLISAALYAPMGVQAATDSAGLEEVVVTATRRAESVQDVPVSVTVFSQEQMDIQGVKQVDDIARLSPSVQFGRGGGFGSDLGNFISIRGMGSFSGPATTGIYVDDTPTQVGATIASGSFTDNAYPMLFDIERVEVLNGPQGTLFGSGSEGGAVRFIQPAPNMSKSALYARTEVSGTTYGAPSYEAGIAGGAPLVPDVLGFRASVWTRHTGGYVDHVDYYTGNTVNPDNNYQDAVSLRLALGWQPVEGLMITPSFYYQRIKANGDNMFYFPSDGIGDVILPQPYGDPEHGDYVSLKQLNQFGRQTMKLGSLKIDWTLPHSMELFSNTSYYRRAQSGLTDFAPLEAAFWANAVWPPDPKMTFPGADGQGNRFFTQEVRLQSTDSDARFKWLVGAFYSDTKTSDYRYVSNPFLPQLLSTNPCFGVPISCYDLFFQGRPLADGKYSFKGATDLVEKQKAAFGQVDFKIVGGLVATLGLRYSKFDTDWTNYEGGPVTGANWPGPGGQPEHGTASASVVIPKYMLSYKTDNTLSYLSATKGFRNGGVNAPINNPACADDLASLGLTAVPGSFEPDKLWSYELGTKLQMLNRRLIVDAAVYQYDWSNMISNQLLSSCTLSYTTNIGSARGRGFELGVQYLPIRELSLGMNLGYTKMIATQTVRATPTEQDPLGEMQVEDGQFLSDSGRLNANAQYQFNIAERKAYFRVDYNYNRRPGFENNPNTPASYQPDPRKIFLTPGYGSANVRLGMEAGGWNVSLFSNNVFNKQPYLNMSRATVSFFGTPTSVKTATTLVPRTYGVTALYRY